MPIQVAPRISVCPGFGQDRAHFHQKPGEDTTGRADPTWSNRTGYSIPCAVVLGSRLGEVAGGKLIAAQECMGHRVVRVALCISLFVLYTLLISIVFVIVCFICCSAKLPLPRPTSFLPFSSHYPPHPSGGEGPYSHHVAFCCQPQPKCNTVEKHKSSILYDGIRI